MVMGPSLLRRWAVGGGWGLGLAVGGGWGLAVGGWWGLSIRLSLTKKESGFLRIALNWGQVRAIALVWTARQPRPFGSQGPRMQRCTGATPSNPFEAVQGAGPLLPLPPAPTGRLDDDGGVGVPVRRRGT